jgi:hypothetical protein
MPANLYMYVYIAKLKGVIETGERLKTEEKD